MTPLLVITVVRKFVPTARSIPLKIGIQGVALISACAGIAHMRTAAARSFLNASLTTVFVFVAGNRIARVGGVDPIVINGNEVHMAIDETDDALGVVVERLVFSPGAAAMPGERRVRRPLHREQRDRGFFD